MTYIKNIWVDQDVERPRTYQVTHNSDGSITLIDDFGNVINLGTPVNADHMNHIEDGIANNDTRITELENSAQKSEGLPLGYIGPALFVDESKGYDRYLNGQLIEINETTRPFLNWLKTLIPLHPNLFTTETDWQNAKTQSALGQVGKFVIDENAGTIRLPAIVNLQGTFDAMQVGQTKAAGLPNITGTIENNVNRIDTAHSIGAFSPSSQTHLSLGGGNIGLNFCNITLNASNANSIYGNSTTVQPEAIQVQYFIRVATGETVQSSSFNELKNISQEISNLKAELSNLKNQVKKSTKTKNT